MAQFNPTLFVRQVRQEVAKVSWPTRKETLITTGLVFAFVTVAAIFFTIVDAVIGIGVRGIFGFGS
jgi:preprotein translocase subunit SecE